MTMKKTASAIALALMVGACGDWVPPDSMTPGEAAKAAYECERDANLILAAGRAPISSGIMAGLQQNQCMRANGFTYQRR